MCFFDNANKKIINLATGDDFVYRVYHVEIVTKLDHKLNEIYFIRYIHLFNACHNNILKLGYTNITDYCNDFDFLNSINREYSYNIIYYYQNEYHSLCNIYNVDDTSDFFESIITKKPGFGCKMIDLNKFWNYLYNDYECKSEDAIFKHSIFDNVCNELINYIKEYFYFSNNIVPKPLISLNDITYFCKNRYLYGCNTTSNEKLFGWKHYLLLSKFEDYFNLNELQKISYDNYETTTSYLFDNIINDNDDNL